MVWCVVEGELSQNSTWKAALMRRSFQSCLKAVNEISS